MYVCMCVCAWLVIVAAASWVAVVWCPAIGDVVVFHIFTFTLSLSFPGHAAASVVAIAVAVAPAAATFMVYASRD